MSSSYLGLKLKDRYRVERELGRGGFAVVYLARDEHLHSKQVVIKVLLETSPDAAWFRKKFADEREALARIDHPGVVGVLDAGEAPDGRQFLVLQFVDGVTLHSARPRSGWRRTNFPPPPSPRRCRCRSTRFLSSSTRSGRHAGTAWPGR